MKITVLTDKYKGVAEGDPDASLEDLLRTVWDATPGALRRDPALRGTFGAVLGVGALDRRRGGTGGLGAEPGAAGAGDAPGGMDREGSAAGQDGHEGQDGQDGQDDPHGCGC